MKSLYLATLFIFISSIHHMGLAKVNSEFTKTRLGRKAPQPMIAKSKKRRKLFLNFSGAQMNSESNKQDQTNGGTLTSGQGSSKVASPAETKIGFNSQIEFGYSNSAYRYAGENYPSKSFDFGIAPSFETTCFSLRCIYLVKITGGFDLNNNNNNNKSELAMIQMGLKLPGDPWGGYFTPTYSFLGYLPAAPKEINDDHMMYGFGGAFSLATTPELMGSKLLAFTGSLSIRKNIHDGSLDKQADWTTRQAIVTDINFTDTFGATLVFGHIYSLGYDKAEKEITELIQGLHWQTLKWLELSISHSNTGPMFKGEGTALNTDLISIDNSVISLGVGITNSF